MIRTFILAAIPASLLAALSDSAQGHNGTLMAESFAPFKPSVRFYWDSSSFYVEGDSMPNATLMPNPMVGITSWQQQLPITLGYFGNITNPEPDSASLGYGQPNVWKIPMVPVAAASSISLTGNFLRGAVAVAANGIAIFNPRNNTGQFSQAIGELDQYGGHCGKADDYHYHIAPTHLTAVLGNSKPVAWALDGYPIYGYLEPDGSAQLALDTDGGHDHGAWGYHYHARGTVATGPQSPYLMNAMHGTVVNYGGQIDPQPTVGSIAPAGSPLAGAVITGFSRPAKGQYALTYTVSGTTYNVAWQEDRIAHTVAVQHETPTGNTTGTYTSAARFNYYPLAGPSMLKLPDTGQTLSATATFGQDSDYTRNPPSYTDNGNGTITDNVTGLMWQKVDSGEMTWENSIAGAAGLAVGGYTDWRLPTAQEAFCILNHDRNPALDSTYFVNNVGGTPAYFWTSDLFYGDNTKAWATNTGGGVGPHPKTSTISAGGSLRFHARYVRGALPTVGHNYFNNLNGTITDTDTGLMWAQVPSSAMTWANALTYAEGLSLGGYSDWRLPNVKELQSLVDLPRAIASSSTTAPCINRTLFPAASATAHWTSTSVKAGTPTQAWLVDFGVTTSSTPSRNQQGIVSYEPYSSSYPAFAVRSVATSSITQGRATTTTTNLLPTGQRVSGVGSITATDGTVWTVPAATQFATAMKAGDLYNEVVGVTPANIAAAATAISNVPTVVVDADGEVVTGYIFADNYFELYVNGTLIAVDPVPYTPFNSCVVKFKAKRPITYAIKLVDWEENLGLGTELNGVNAYYLGDGGLMASFSDGTVTNSSWKAQSFNIAPLDNPSLVTDLANGTHDSSAVPTTHTLTETAYALHYAVPTDWFSKTFIDSGWPSATTYAETVVGVNNKPAYTNFPAQFSTSGAQFIWSSNLVLDNEVIVRYTGPATVQQISIEQPTSTPLTDGVSIVDYGNVDVGSTLTKSFTIRNNGTTSLTISGTAMDGASLTDFTVTTPPVSSIAAGGSTTMEVRFAPASSGSKTAALHITSSAASVGAAFDVSLTGAGTLPAPTITSITTSPAVPTSLDSPWVNATIQAGSGATIASAQLSYNGGLPTTSTVFTETMAATAVTPWTGAGAVNSWTTIGGNTVKQVTAANHGTGNLCGLQFDKGTVNLVDSMVTTSSNINATGTSGNVEFWLSAASMVSPNGWTFQLSTDGTNWTTRLSELSGSIHAVQLYHYDLLASERVSTLKMRFQFAGYNAVAPTPAPKVNIDDITVVTTNGSAAVTLTMLDDGLHNDGSAGDGVYGVQIPAKTSGTTVSYTIAATDNNNTVTTSSAGSYTVATAAPVLALTPATGLSSSGASGGGAFSPSSATYTLTNTGTGAMSWTASKTASWLSLSNSSGTLAAGASTTITASINTASANSLTTATYNDTITFTNGSNGTGNTTRAVSLLVTAGVPTAPTSPSFTALPAYSSGTSKSLSWPAVSTATGYTVQVATDSAFTANVVSQVVTSPTAAFSNLTNGVTYFYRVLASNSIGSSSYSSYVSSTQDAVAPAVAIAYPVNGSSTTSNSITVTGSSSDGLSGISGVKVNNVAATSSNGFATWSATVPLCFGTNGITATATDGAGNLATSSAILITDTTWQTYNPLYIPDVITGTTFNLTLSQKSKQFPYLGTTLQTNTTAPSTLGTATTTLGYNGALMWGPTLIMNQGDAVQLNVTNSVPVDTTTVHWHGFHIPAIMDGGPHQVIPSGTTWSPTFTVKNNAATYWYHPHLHTTTQKQLTMGAGGFIIVRDPQETALALPRTYGVDDIPLALTSRRFVAPNEFGSNQYTQSDGTTSTLDNYGDFVLVNGTPTNVSISGTGAGAAATLYPPQVSLPKQYVRLRILNAEIQRGYNLGFSDNRTFYVITNDQGLLNAPVPVSRMFLMVGERVEILVNLGSDAVGSSFDLKAYNSGQVFGFPGQEGTPKLPNGASGGENGSLLNNTDFSLLHINVAASTASAITSLPSTLANNSYWTNANVTNTRTIAITGGNGSTPGFKFDNIGYTPTLFNHTINLNAVEKWTVSAGNIFGHSLHIHDVKFNILARTGGTQVTSTGLAAPYESGWKDTVYIPKGETVSVIAKYDDFASNTNPFMFHCHFLNHEDGGMMGQFVVVNHAVEDLAIASFTRDGANREINLQFKSTVGTTYTLQYSADMTTSSWVDIASVTSDGTSANFTETDATRLSQARGFYRVTIPAIP